MINKISVKGKLFESSFKKAIKIFSLTNDSQPETRKKLIDLEEKESNVNMIEVKNIDFNNTLILLNVLVRKFTKEKFVSEKKEELSVLDARLMALNILESFEKILDDTFEKYRIKNESKYLAFDPTSLISEIVWHLRNENKLDKISKLLNAVLEKNYKELKDNDQQIKYELVKSLENALAKQLNIQNKGLLSNYSFPVFGSQIRPINDLRLKPQIRKS